MLSRRSGFCNLNALSIGRSLNGKMAHIHGINYPFHERVRMQAVYREYHEGFQNLYDQAFGEKSNGSNERGLYLGMNILPLPYLDVQVFTDLYRHPWLAYRVNAPSGGEEYAMTLRYSKRSNVTWTMMYRYERNELNDSGEESRFVVQEDRKLHQFRLQVDYKVSDQWRFRNRVSYRQFSHGGDENELGYSVYQDVYFAPTY